MNEILKVLVGSRAHGLARPDSDYDYRGVFVEPTERLLAIGPKAKTTNWQEGRVDDTSWELGHFLHLATKCNPTILEVFGAPVQEPITAEGIELRRLLPAVLNSRHVFNAFKGYSHNQWKKLNADQYGNERGRVTKYAMAAVRVLMQGQHLFNTGEMLVEFADTPYLKELEMLRERLEENSLTNGQILDKIDAWRTGMFEAMENRYQPFEQDLHKVNVFLLQTRRSHWGTEYPVEKTPFKSFA